MKDYIKNEIKLLPVIIVLFIIFLVVVKLINGNSPDIKKNYNNKKDVFTVGDINSAYACVNGNYSTYNNRLTTINNKIGTGTLTTTNKTLVGGINELRGRFDIQLVNTYVLPITKGGTGATGTTETKAKENARSNLEVPTPSDFPSRTSSSKTAKGITIYYQKYGNLITVTLNGTLTSAMVSEDTVLTNLSAAYRPPAVVVFPCFSNQNGSSYKDVVYMFLRANGDIKAHVNLSSGSNLYCSISYMTTYVSDSSSG